MVSFVTERDNASNDLELENSCGGDKQVNLEARKLSRSVMTVWKRKNPVMSAN